MKRISSHILGCDSLLGRAVREIEKGSACAIPRLSCPFSGPQLFASQCVEAPALALMEGALSELEVFFGGHVG